MHYLITGGAGFIGSHLAELLLNEGQKVTIVDDLSSGSLQNLQKCNPTYFYHTSITDEFLMEGRVKKCDYIFHLAAVVGVAEAFNHPLRTMQVNVEGTRSLLELAHAYNKKILIASSSEVYGYGKQSNGLSELDPGIIGSPCRSMRWCYGVSKMIDEFLALGYSQLGLPVVIVRPFNVVGPRQTGYYGMVMPRFVEQALAGKPLTVYGDGQQTRCFAYATEIAQALYELMHAPKAEGQIINLASQNTISILNLAHLVKEITGSSSEIAFVPYEQAYGPGFDDAMHRRADITKLEQTLGWTPSMSLKEIIQKIVEWKSLQNL